MIYIASPYSHDDPAVMQKRFELAQEFVAESLNAGVTVFSPIVHCHEMAQKFNMPTDFDFWQKYCTDMLSCATMMVVLPMQGWQDSKGIASEIQYCEDNKIEWTLIEGAKTE